MRKFKIFMMLTSLCVGVSSAWAQTTWTDGIFDYSTTYRKDASTSINLPTGEVAISLHLDDTETVTDTMAYASLLWNASLGSSRSLADDDGDGVGTTATFTYLGYHTNGFDGGPYFYSRLHQVACSRQTSVTIPATVSHEGTTYKVTAIQGYGFGYRQSHQMMISYCNDPSTSNPSVDESRFWGAINGYSNRYLTTVRFESPSNVRNIGDYAFASCTKLESIILPNTLEYLGMGAFKMCYSLNDVRFQTLDDGTVLFKTIKNWTFWLCTGLESIELPDGIEEIEGRQAGAAMQYMMGLINVRLPNTLKTIGPHFLCCASSLETLTLPASVTSIDGACLHGCENLKNVYLLGPAAALQKEFSGSTTFSANRTFCKDQVQQCTFWVTDDYYDSYKNDPVWSIIDETTFNADWTEVVSTTGHGNALRKIIQESRQFFAAKWVTAIFPYGVTDYKTAFPTGERETRVAVMDPDATHTVTTGTDPKSGKSIILYNVVYKLIEGNDIPAQTPVMICPGTSIEYTLFTTQDAATEWFKQEASKDHPTTVTADDGATITMKGHYVPYKLHPWDFYFMYQPGDLNEDGSAKSPAKFYRVPSADNAATVGTCRCYWTINVDNVKSDVHMAPGQNAKGFDVFMDDDLSAVRHPEEVRMVVAGIYDLNGRKLDIAPENLPQGIYVVNGKKQTVK